MLEQIFLAANRWALVVLIAAMACTVFANVALRYLTNQSLVWAEEVARYLMVWMTFLGAGLALRQGLHVAVGNLGAWLPVVVAKALRGTILLILLAFCGIMVWYGHDYMTRMGRQLTPATRISFSYIYAAMPIGFSLLAVHVLLVARTYLRTGTFDMRPDAEQSKPASAA
jgi:TRAP-type C4-dicarboxylate transport system permease small subunit